MKTFLQILSINFALLYSLNSEAQYLHQAITEYNDSFKNWEILSTINPFVEDPEIEDGRLGITWDINNDWTDWSYWSGDYRGSVKIDEQQVYTFIQNNGNNSNIISARNVWPRDFSEWTIRYNDQEYQLNLLFKNQAEEWILAHDKNIISNILTYEEGDLRNWFFDHKVEAPIAFEVQQLALLIIIYTVCPKI